MSVDRLVDAMWADEAPAAASRTIRTYISRLRAALGETAVATDGTGYRLDAEPGSIDATRFVADVDNARRRPPVQALPLLDEALARWSGPAFGEFADEWWAIPEAARLEELRLVANEERIEAMLALGEHDRAIADLDALVRAHPLRERLVGQLMRAHHAAGRQPEALRAMAAHRSHVVEETGLDPSPALIDLERAILAGNIPEAMPGGRRLRDYVLGDILGQGAFGTVYRSVQPGVDREVAVKVVRAELADDPTFVRRFETEAQLAAHIEHPHVVPLYDFWREPGGAYLVFRLMRGGSAAARMRRDGPLDVAAATRLLGEVGGALAAAHAAGIVHRDVKPANILFDEDGNAYLADFGIASLGNAAVDESPGSARTLSFASPEQLRRDVLDPRADQYGLALTIHHLLTGTAPFEAGSAEASTERKLAGPLPSVRLHRPDVDLALDAVLQRASAVQPDDRFPDLTSMVAAWHAALGAPATVEPAFVANPYVGLRAFREVEEQQFHGRAALARALFDAVEQRRLVAVVGASGSGKSSLLHAGLVPQLRRHRRRVATMTPGIDPVEQLRHAVRAIAHREPDGADPAAMVRAICTDGGGDVLLIVDQLEELWTVADLESRRRFVRALVTLARDDQTPLSLVLAIRADLFDRPLAEPGLGELVAAGTFPVTPLSEDDLRAAILEPAGAVGLVFEHGLADAIVRDVAAQPGSLPLLQFALTELYERRDGATVTAASYAALGGIGGAVAARAEATYASLDEAQAHAARRLMLRLVSSGDADARRRLRRSELPRGAAAIAERFTANRLLVGDRDRTTREPTIEIAHESLLRSWPRFASWLADDRDRLRQLQHLAGAARSWDDAGRPESELYRGGRLDSIADLVDGGDDDLAMREIEFVDASQTAAAAATERSRAQRHRLQRLLAVAAVALVLALVAGLLAFAQRETADRRADEADVARLVSAAERFATSKRDLAALLALEASRRDPSAVTDGALMSAVYSDLTFQGDLRGTEPDAPGAEIDFAPDGSLWRSRFTPGIGLERFDIASGEHDEVAIPGLGDAAVWDMAPIDDHTVVVIQDDGDPEGAVHEVRLLDTDAGIELARHRIDALPGNVRISPDGRSLVLMTISTADAPGEAIVLSLPDLEPVTTMRQPGPAPEPGDDYFGISAWIDDDTIATPSASQEIVVWRVSTGEQLASMNATPDTRFRLAYTLVATRDGETLIAAVSGNGDGMMAFDVATGEPRWRAPAHVNDSFAVDESNGLIYAQEAGFGSSRLVALELDTGVPTGRVLDIQHGSNCGAAASPDGTRLAASSCNEDVVAVWSLDGTSPTSRALAPADFILGSPALSDDGRAVLVDTSEEGTPPQLVDVVSGEAADPFPFEDPGMGVFFDAAGDLVRVDGVADELAITDLATHDTRTVPVELPDEPSMAALSPDRRLLLLGDQTSGDVTVVDLESGEIAQVLHTDASRALGATVDVDARRVYVAGQEETTQVFDLATGDETGSVPGANVALSPDGTLLATNVFNGRIAFHDAQTLERVGASLAGGTAYAITMAFTPDGRFLLTSGLDGALRVWDVEGRQQVGPTMAVADPSFVLSSDGAILVVATTDGVQRLALDRGALRKAACRVASRNLTGAEWAQHVGGTPTRLCSAYPA